MDRTSGMMESRETRALVNNSSALDAPSDMILIVDCPNSDITNGESNTNKNVSIMPPSSTVNNMSFDGGAAVFKNSATATSATKSCSSASLLVICRICHSSETNTDMLIEPCDCKGSCRYVHQICLQKWLHYNENMTACELCKYNFRLRSRLKPLTSWRLLHVSRKQKKKLCVDLLLYTLAIACNVWTILSFVEIIASRMSARHYDWVFFIVIVIGSTCLAGIFCFLFSIVKLFHKLAQKCIQFNRIIEVESNRSNS